MVSVMIVVLISTVAVISLNPARQSTTTSSAADEVKSAIEELRSYAVGPHRDRVTHYVLVIKKSGTDTESYCNGEGGSNRLNAANQYMICSTFLKDISGLNAAMLNNDFSKVRSGSFSGTITLSDNIASIPGPTPFDDSHDIVLNARTYDYQLGYNGKYYDGVDPAHRVNTTTNPFITVTQGNFSKKITIDPILGVITLSNV